MNVLKKISWLDGILILFLLYFLSQKVPVWWKQYQFQGDKVTSSLPLSQLDGELVELPLMGQGHQALVFWATWCGPCKIELNRIHESVVKKQLNTEKIHLISVREPLETVQSFLKKDFPYFTSFVDTSGKWAYAFQAQGTPTVVLLDDQGQVRKVWTGVSPFLISRLKKHLKP